MDSIEKLTGAQKVAILLLSLPEETSLKIFSMMTEDEIRQISSTMSALGTVSLEVASSISKQFQDEVVSNANFFGNLQNTERLLEKAFGREKAQSFVDEIKNCQITTNTWDKLSKINEDMLAVYLKNEHPQTAAVILSKLPPGNSAKVLSNLDDDVAFDIMSRMLSIGSIKRDIVDNIEKVLKSEFIITLGKTVVQNSFQMLAEVFNNFDRYTEERYMQILEEKSPETAKKVKSLMFTFEDIYKIDRKGIIVLMNNIDKNKLMIALKTASDRIKDVFYSSMSQRGAQIIQEEISVMGPIRIRDVDEAQNHVINKAKELIGKGEISVVESDGGDEYV